RVLPDEGLELPGRDPEAPEVGLGRDRGRAGPRVDQRHLAEVVTGPERGHRAIAHPHGGPPVDDDEEAGAGAPLHRDVLPRPERVLAEALGQPGELALLEPGEERNPAQGGGGVAQAAILPCAARHANAEIPVMPRPTMSAFTHSVPS